MLAGRRGGKTSFTQSWPKGGGGGGSLFPKIQFAAGETRSHEESDFKVGLQLRTTLFFVLFCFTLQFYCFRKREGEREREIDPFFPLFSLFPKGEERVPEGGQKVRAHFSHPIFFFREIKGQSKIKKRWRDRGKTRKERDFSSSTSPPLFSIYSLSLLGTSSSLPFYFCL